MGTKLKPNEANTLDSQTGLLPLRTRQNPSATSSNNNDDELEREGQATSATEEVQEQPVGNNLGNETEDVMSVTPRFCPGTLSFPYLFTASFYKFGVYIHKLFQDSSAVHTYYQEGNTRFMVVSAAALACPTLLYVVFLLGSRFARSRRGSECAEWFAGMLNGALLVAWQIKGRADVLHFISQRICERRKPTKDEGEHVETLNRQASVLEFFEQFYAGFLQLVLQLYIFILTLSSVNKATAAQPLIGQIIASVLALISTVKAVQRKDDGILTGFLSMVGWCSFFASRFVAISLAASIIHHWIGLACAAHVIGVSVWISRVAWQSHETPCTNDASPDPLTCRQKTSIFFLVLAMFGLPSLTFWPIMFQMKERKRPFIFILVCALENAASFLVWYFGRKTSDKTPNELTTPDYVCLGILIGGMILGSLCIVAYTLCKPRYTDEVVMYNVKVDNANSYGIFYDFCDATFKLPKTEKIGRALRQVRNAN